MGERYAHHRRNKASESLWDCMTCTAMCWEWVQDWYKYDYYSSSPSVDPQGPSSGSSRVIRGGDFGGNFYPYATDVRSAYRYYNSPSSRYGPVGFRLLRQAQ